MKFENDKWKVTTERFVGFFDIMGFKDMVMSNSHEDIIRMIEDLKNAKTVTIDGRIGNTSRQTNLKSFLFSDSFFIFSASDTPGDLLNLLYNSNVLVNYCFSQKIPLKGAISFGKATADFDRSIFVGQPIIDAYLLHEELHMFGVILDHNVEKKLNEVLANEDYSDEVTDQVVQYKVPTKNGRINHYCINQ